MEFYKVINTRRSIRKYSRKDIPKDVLERVMLTAGKAPSGRNRQNWKYILVYDNKIRNKLVAHCLNKRFIINCPVTVIVCGNVIPDHNRGKYMGKYGSVMDAAVTFDHFTLAARAEGLGTCWIGRFNNTEIKTILDIPSDWNIVAISPLGYPEDENAFKSCGNRINYDKLVSIDCFTSKE